MADEHQIEKAFAAIRARGDRAFHAYYFDVDPTGDNDIDLILMALAAAGKGYHHTDQWSDGGPTYEEDGLSYIDTIQAAANRAASEMDRLRKIEAAAWEHLDADRAQRYGEVTDNRALRARKALRQALEESGDE